jgi:predicted RNA binding protein YcfA (HicA-like mRNA interferase family)
MSKISKIIQRITAKPVPSNIKWDELVTLLEHLGFKLLKNSGSRRKFFNEDIDRLISLHEPHPSPEVLPCYIKDVVANLQDWGLI